MDDDIFEASLHLEQQYVFYKKKKNRLLWLY